MLIIITLLLLQVAIRNQKEFGLSQVLWPVHMYPKHTADELAGGIFHRPNQISSNLCWLLWGGVTTPLCICAKIHSFGVTVHI